MYLSCAIDIALLWSGRGDMCAFSLLQRNRVLSPLAGGPKTDGRVSERIRPPIRLRTSSDDLTQKVGGEGETQR